MNEGDAFGEQRLESGARMRVHDHAATKNCGIPTHGRSARGTGQAGCARVRHVEISMYTTRESATKKTPQNK
jgi:hypothetical protein